MDAQIEEATDSVEVRGRSVNGTKEPAQFLKSESQFSTSVMGAVVSGGVPRAIMNLLPSRDTS